jgi:Bacterial dnaA protein helix-turn-helix
MSLVAELHAQRKARLLRLGFGPKLPSAPLPEPPAIEPPCEPEPITVAPEIPNERDWLIIATPDRDFVEYPLLVHEVQRLVAKHFKIKRADLLSPRRTMDCTLPRQIAMYLAKKATLRSLPEIGRRFGGRDHTTVLHAIRKIERLRRSSAEFDAQIKELEKGLNITEAGNAGEELA